MTYFGISRRVVDRKSRDLRYYQMTRSQDMSTWISIAVHIAIALNLLISVCQWLLWISGSQAQICVVPGRGKGLGFSLSGGPLGYSDWWSEGIDLESNICRYLRDSPHVCLSGDRFGKHKLSLFIWFSPCWLVWGSPWKVRIGYIKCVSNMSYFARRSFFVVCISWLGSKERGVWSVKWKMESGVGSVKNRVQRVKNGSQRTIV